MERRRDYVSNELAEEVISEFADMGDLVTGPVTTEDIHERGGPQQVADDIIDGYYTMLEGGHYTENTADFASLNAFLNQIPDKEIDQDPKFFQGLQRLECNHYIREYCREYFDMAEEDTKAFMKELFAVFFESKVASE